MEWFTHGNAIRVELWERTRGGFRVNVRYHHRLMYSHDIETKEIGDAKVIAETIFESIKQDFNGHG